jgi:hypothetical protein
LSQAAKIGLGVAVTAGALVLAHGYLNLGWFKDKVRAELIVGHLPVT